MTDALTLTIDQYLLLSVTLALFAFLGWKRGVSRELLSMVGIGLAILAAPRVAPVAQPVINQVHALARSAAGANAAPQVAGQALIKSAADLQTLGVLIFALIVIAAYLVGQRLARAAGSFGSRLLGTMAGAINGFLVAYHLFPAVLNRPRAVIMLPGAQLENTLSSPRNVALVVVFFVVLLVAFGLYSANAGRAK